MDTRENTHIVKTPWAFSWTKKGVFTGLQLTA
jgi:hypothetical protein